MSKRRIVYGLATLGAIAVVAASVATCSSDVATAACPPEGDTREGRLLARARAEAAFPLVYPCDQPASERLETASVTGTPGRQQAEFGFEGPFEIKLRQSQYPPAVSPDPTGASRVEINLHPNVRAILIERNDGSRRALYHLFWEQSGIHYEVQAFGPPLQRQTILNFARSLQ